MVTAIATPTQSMHLPMATAKTITATSTVLVVFDSRVQDLDILYSALLPNATAHTISEQDDALTVITQLLAETGAQQLAIVAHGQPGVVNIGASPLNQAQLQARSHLLQEWGIEAIALYSCEVAQGEGLDFIHQLNEVTGATVAASATKTGHQDLKGDWNLEVTAGQSTPQFIFHHQSIANYVNILASANDDFANALLLTGSSGGVTGFDNIGATDETREASQSSTINSIWWNWTAPANGTTTFDTIGSNFDTFLSIFTGNTVDSLTTIGQNDDYDHYHLQSRVSFNTTAGTTYRIAVDGFGSKQGNVSLNYSFNAAPTLTGSAATLNPGTEDTSYTINASDLLQGFSDAEGDSFSVTNLASANGSLTNNGNGTYTFNPNADYNGSVTLTYNVTDNNGGNTAATQTFNLAAVNDVPSFTAANPSVILEDAGAQTVTGWVTAFDPGAVNESGQTVNSYIISNISNSGLFSVAPSVDANGNLTYTPAAGVSGSSTFDIQVQDDGGTTNSGVDTSTVQTFTITVNDNDILHSVSAVAGTITEGDSGSTPTNVFTIIRSGVTSQQSTVDFALSGIALNGTDYNNISISGTGVSLSGNTITFAAGATTATLVVDVQGDQLYEGTSESVDITLSNAATSATGYSAAISSSTASQSIVDDDPVPNVSLSLDSSSFNENGGITTITATLDAVSGKDVTIDLGFSGTAGGSDYTTSASSITILAGDTTGSITLTGSEDSSAEGNEFVTVDITNVTNGAESGTQQLDVGINDNDVPGITLSKTGLSVTEGGTTATYTVVLNTQPTAAVTVSFNTGSQVDAIANLTFDQTGATAWNIPQTVTVTTTDDTAVEGNHSQIISHTVTSTDADYNGVAVNDVTAAIADNDINYGVSVNKASVVEGNTGNKLVTFTINRTGDLSQSSSVAFGFQGTASNSDYALVGVSGATISESNSTLVFGANATQAVLTVAIHGDSTVELDETLQLRLQNATAPGTATVSGNPASVKIVNDDVAIVEGEMGTPTPAIVFQRGGNSQVIQGTQDSDYIRGNPFQNKVVGRGGSDRIFGGRYDRWGLGKDVIYGGAGDDYINGGRGRDYLDGGTGNDEILGKQGKDILVGGAGKDTLSGGQASDMFVYKQVSEGGDTITDFNTASDLMDMRKVFTRSEFQGGSDFSRFNQFIRLQQVGSNTQVQIDADGNGAGTNFVTLATLQGVAANAVKSSNFVLS